MKLIFITIFFSVFECQNFTFIRRSLVAKILKPYVTFRVPSFSSKYLNCSYESKHISHQYFRGGRMKKPYNISTTYKSRKKTLSCSKTRLTSLWQKPWNGRRDECKKLDAVRNWHGNHWLDRQLNFVCNKFKQKAQHFYIFTLKSTIY